MRVDSVSIGDTVCFYYGPFGNDWDVAVVKSIDGDTITIIDVARKHEHTVKMAKLLTCSEEILNREVMVYERKCTIRELRDETLKLIEGSKN